MPQNTDKNKTTIFKQLILNLVLPVVLSMFALSVINYLNTKRIIDESNTKQNLIISEGVTKVLEFQDKAFELIEVSMSAKMETNSSKLVNEIFRNTKNIETADLDMIRRQLDMDTEREDIYIIDRNGIIVNTTFEQDKGLNLFSFGERYKNYLEEVFNLKIFVNEIFSIEDQTKRPKKYTYQPTLDGKYIIELGSYSKNADEIISFIEKTKADIVRKQGNIIDVELFFMADKPFSLNTNAFIKEGHEAIMMDRFAKKDTSEVLERVEKQWYHYQYIYMDRKNSNLYKGSVIRIISDRTAEQLLIRKELLRFFIIFAFTLLAVMILVYNKTKVITAPIIKLVEKVRRITDGHLDERAEVVGNNEITELSVQFNYMIKELESYTNELEDKVRERTAEIRQQKEKIEAQRDTLEDQKRNITDSIHYAKRIQTAILPPDNVAEKLLNDYFILYKPKDIVSGDFYWLDKKDGLVMLAAVDCTGHGVPGAFMSIVGFNQLNYAVNVKKSRKASEILEVLNEGVAKTLRENQKESNVKDGMDMALCVIDFESKKLQFSGAINPLIMIRDGELTQIKGDKKSIGPVVSGEPARFTNHEIDLKKNDCFYMFSDGYADQFGGPDNKKYMIRRFRDFLTEVHQKPMSQQMEILDQEFNDWKGDEEQVDDVIVMGIRI